MSLASLSHQPQIQHIHKKASFTDNYEQTDGLAPVPVTNGRTITTTNTNTTQQQQHQNYDEYTTSPVELSSDSLELSPPTTPIPSTKNKQIDNSNLRDPLLRKKVENNNNNNNNFPQQVQALHERTLNQFFKEGDDIILKRHSTHDALLHSKRRETMGVIPLHLDTTTNNNNNKSNNMINDPLDSSINSNTTTSAHPSSSIHTTNNELARHSSTSTLTRHNTTGHVLSKPKKKPITEISEDFQKELTARRKAFRRLSRKRRDTDDDEDRVMIGTRIGEGHQNYILMYNMLTGIRIAVGRVSAKIDRSLTDDDFSAAHKLAFDVTGDELTPGAKYDFKFKDYAPWVFRHLREQFGIDPADYLISLTSKYILSELGSPGKSGSFFYYSRDYRFIIKTIHHTEHKFMRKILRQYHDHVINNPNTLLCRYYGLHRVKLPRGRKIHFVVMGNVFPPNKDVHETYDLKGSTIGRLLPEEEIRKNPSAVMKDLNWEKRGRKLKLGPQKRGLFIKQLVRDVRLLVHLNIMDYSLLIGVHDMLRGNRDKVRDSTLHAFQPDTKSVERRDTLMKRRQSKAQVVRKAIAQANPDKLDLSELPDDPEERRNCVFYSDEGGFQATDEMDQPTGILYFMGIIDILTPYDTKKKTEHMFKSLTQDKNAISAVKPSIYGDRFMGYMSKTLEYNQDIPQEYNMSS